MVTWGATCCFFFFDFLEVVEEEAGGTAACCGGGMAGGLDTTVVGRAVGMDASASSPNGGSNKEAGMVLLAVTAPTSIGGMASNTKSSTLLDGSDMFK